MSPFTALVWVVTTCMSVCATHGPTLIPSSLLPSPSSLLPPPPQRNRSILVISQEQEGMKREKEKIEVGA